LTWGFTKSAFLGALGGSILLILFFSTVRQKNRNAVFNRINVFAFRALKIIFFFTQRRTARRAD
jgi:hypothetical protein